MRLESEDTITTAIERYAVSLNRLGWLDQNRLEAQRTTWIAWVEHYGGGSAGVVTLADLFAAMDPQGRESREVLPPSIVLEAVKAAMRRAAAAREIIHNAPDMTLANLRAQLAAMQRSALDAAERRIAVDVFAESVARMVKTLEYSGYARDEIDPVVKRITAEADAVIGRAAPA